MIVAVLTQQKYNDAAVRDFFAAAAAAGTLLQYCRRTDSSAASNAAGASRKGKCPADSSTMTRWSCSAVGARTASSPAPTATACSNFIQSCQPYKNDTGTRADSASVLMP